MEQIRLLGRPNAKLKTSNIVIRKKNGQIRIFHSTYGNLSEINPYLKELIEICRIPRQIKYLINIYGVNVKKVLARLLSLGFLEFTNKRVDAVRIMPHRSIQLRLFLCEKCNFDCKYCYESANDRKSGKIMSKGIIRKSYSFFKDFFALDIKPWNEIQLRIYGGEPLLCWSRVKYAIELGSGEFRKSAKRFLVYLNTNGSLLTLEIVKFLRERNVIVIISIDGLRKHNKNRVFYDGTETFYDSLDGIRLCIKNGVKLGVNVTVDFSNLYEMKKIIDGLKKHGVTDISFNRLKPGPNFSPQNVKEGYYKKFAENVWKAYVYGTKREMVIGGLWARLKERLVNGDLYYCNGCGFEFGISPIGEIYPCPHVYGLEKYKIGNVVSRELYQEKYNCWLNRNSMNIKECSRCKYRGICSGGCAAVALFNKSNIMNGENCSFHKYLIEKLVWDIKI